MSDVYHLLNFKATAPHLNETVQMGKVKLRSDGPVTVNFDLTAAARYTTTDTMDVELIVNEILYHRNTKDRWTKKIHPFSTR